MDDLVQLVSNADEDTAKNKVRELILTFLDEHALDLWYKPTKTYGNTDDLQKYAIEVSSISLLLMIFIHSIKYGDITSIRACHKIFSIFFFAMDGNSSNYSPSLMNQLIDYHGASLKEKSIIDLFSSINCYGSEGCGVAADMVCEWGVKEVKKYERKVASNIEVTLMERKIKSSNVISNIKDDFLDSILCPELKSSSGHSSRIIKEQDIEDIRYSRFLYDYLPYPYNDCNFQRGIGDLTPSYP